MRPLGDPLSGRQYRQVRDLRVDLNRSINHHTGDQAGERIWNQTTATIRGFRQALRNSL